MFEMSIFSGFRRAVYIVLVYIFTPYIFYIFSYIFLDYIFYKIYSHTCDRYWRYAICTVFFQPHSQCTGGTPKFIEYENVYSTLNFLLNVAIFLSFLLPRHWKTSLILVYTNHHVNHVHKGIFNYNCFKIFRNLIEIF